MQIELTDDQAETCTDAILVAMENCTHVTFRKELRVVLKEFTKAKLKARSKQPQPEEQP